jgi:GNAT superfamily N-acetyltransferase
VTAWTPGELAVLTDSGSLNLSAGDDGQPGAEIGMVVVGGELPTLRILDVEYRPTEIYLTRIEISPDHQGHGIGTRLVSALIDEAWHKARTWSSTYSPSTTVPRLSTSGSA